MHVGANLSHVNNVSLTAGSAVKQMCMLFFASHSWHTDLFSFYFLSMDETEIEALVISSINNVMTRKQWLSGMDTKQMA